MGGSWLLSNLLWPTLQSIAGAGILAAAVMGSEHTAGAVSGCPANVAHSIAEGERALSNGKLERARALARDGIVLAPGSSCANVLLAAVELKLMEESRAIDDAEGAEDHRSQCFRRAKAATPMFGTSPRVEALLTTCSAAAIEDGRLGGDRITK